MEERIYKGVTQKQMHMLKIAFSYFIGEQACTAMMTSNNLGNCNVAFSSTDEKEEERLDYMRAAS